MREQATNMAVALRPAASGWARLSKLAKRKPLGTVSALLIASLILVAIFAGPLAPYDPIKTQVGPALSPPSPRFLLGTDNVGRDVFSRIIFGSRVSLAVGLVSVTLGVGVGSLIGIISGYFEGRVDLFVQRAMDSIQAFPALILALAIVSVLGPSITNAMVAIAVVIMPGVNRVVRGAVLSVKQNQYVEGARAIGSPTLRILALHILPNVAAPIIVLVSVDLGNAIIVEASLSFLGLGTQPPTPSWGEMLSGPGRVFLQRAPWLAVFPGLAISLAVLGFNMLGDALRDVLDPRLRGT